MFSVRHVRERLYILLGTGMISRSSISPQETKRMTIPTPSFVRGAGIGTPASHSIPLKSACTPPQATFAPHPAYNPNGAYFVCHLYRKGIRL